MFTSTVGPGVYLPILLVGEAGRVSWPSRRGLCGSGRFLLGVLPSHNQDSELLEARASVLQLGKLRLREVAGSKRPGVGLEPRAGPEPMLHADGALGSRLPAPCSDPAAGCHVSGLGV